MRRRSRRQPRTRPEPGAPGAGGAGAAHAPRPVRAAHPHPASAHAHLTHAHGRPARAQVADFGTEAAPADLETRIGYQFRSPALLERALTHASAAREQGSAVVESQRLEFLGDAVLGFLVGEMIYHRGPTLAEGPMSRLRAALVQEATLAERARAVGLPAAIRLGKGEERSGGRDKPSIQADTYEALLAAIYLDGGMEAARVWVERQFAPLLEHEIGLGPEGPIVIEPSRKRLGRGRSRTGRSEGRPGWAGRKQSKAAGQPARAGSKRGKAASHPGEAGAQPDHKPGRAARAVSERQPGASRARPPGASRDGRQAQKPHGEVAAQTRAARDGGAAPPVRDSKTALQEWLQARGRALPLYRLLDTAGPDHARRFTVEVQVEGQPLGTGESTTKKGAEAQAALGALRRLEGTSDRRHRALEEEGGRLSSGKAARRGKGRSGSRRARGR